MTKFLDMMTSQFTADLISQGVTGACTAKSQTHREMASTLSYPMGFKNGTDNNARIAVDATRATRASHMLLSPDRNGQMTIYQTSGNSYDHIIMRGGKKPNYHAGGITAAYDTPHEFDLPEHLVMDFSHDNRQKQCRRQLEVYEGICQQIRNGSTVIARIVAESFPCEGMQRIVGGQSLTYDQSITDLCLDWEDTERLTKKLASTADTHFRIRAYS